MNGDLEFHWTRKLCNVRFEGIGKFKFHASLQLLSYRLCGGLNNDLTWSLKTVPAGTEVLLNITYNEPLPV